ncbi:hypothetical protein [Methylibium sp.]|uniref:hypothetical protein n=1 Tax=Methylibium sp. TaxID=2067992 RepID=UPI003D0D19A7
MGAIFGSVGVGLLCGLLVYAAVRWAWPEIDAREFTNLIGLAAVLGAAAAGLIARRRAARGRQEGKNNGKR